VKARHLLLRAILCAAFFAGAAYALPPNASQRSSSTSEPSIGKNQPGSTRDGMADAKKPSANKIPIPPSQHAAASHVRRGIALRAGKGDRTRQSATNEPHLRSAPPASVSPGVRRVSRHTTATLQNGNLSSGLPNRLPTNTAYTPSSFHSVRHRNGNAAIVGGLPSPKTGSTGLNGTLVNRKP